MTGKRIVPFLLTLVLIPVSALGGGAPPKLEVRVWLYDTWGTRSRADDDTLSPFGSDSTGFYWEANVDATGGLGNPARLNSNHRIWDVYSDDSTVYRLVFQFQADTADLKFSCWSDWDAYWFIQNSDAYWADTNVFDRQLILTASYNDGYSDPDLITDYESNWWSDPKDIGASNAPDTILDITRIDEHRRLECVDATRSWAEHAYNTITTLPGNTDSTLVWEIHFQVDDDWTDNDTANLHLYMNKAGGGHTTDILFKLHTTNPKLKWQYPQPDSPPIASGIISSPVIRGGRVYVTASDNKLYCLTASDGSLIWSYATLDPIQTSPAAVYEDPNWTIYFANEGGYVYAVTDTGGSYEQKWVRLLTAGNSIRSSPAVMDSLLYVGCWDDSIHCLRKSDGSSKWAVYLSGVSNSSPAVYNNVVYIGSYSDTLYAMNAADGTVLRKYGTCGNVIAPVFMTWTDGRICIGSYASATPGSDTMYVIESSNFNTYWKFADWGNLARTRTSCFSANDTTVYFGNDNNYLYCIDISDSSLVYKYDAGDDIGSSPLCWNGAVYFGSNSDRFHALDDGNQQPRPYWPFVANADIRSSPAISVPDSMVVVGSSDGHVYAFDLE